MSSATISEVQSVGAESTSIGTCLGNTLKRPSSSYSDATPDLRLAPVLEGQKSAMSDTVK